MIKFDIIIVTLYLYYIFILRDIQQFLFKKKRMLTLFQIIL